MYALLYSQRETFLVQVHEMFVSDGPNTRQTQVLVQDAQMNDGSVEPYGLPSISLLPGCSIHPLDVSCSAFS